MNRIKERENEACKKLVATIKSVQERELYSCSLLYSNEKLKISKYRANVKKKKRHLERKKTRISIQANKNKKELEELIENAILITSREMGCLPWYDKT